MFGSLTAILLSAILSFLGRRFPELTGEGRLQPEESEELATDERDEPVDLDVTHIAGAGLLIITLYLLGLICFQTFLLPAPVAMLLLAVLLKLLRGVPPPFHRGSHVVYQFLR